MDGNGTGFAPTTDFTSTASMNPGYYVTSPSPNRGHSIALTTDPNLWGWGVSPAICAALAVPRSSHTAARASWHYEETASPSAWSTW